MTAQDDPFVERMRFTTALIEASEVFQDLRYLNTAMKLVDRALTELRRPLRDQDGTSARHREIAYLTTLSAQETRMREVITG